MMKQPFHMTRMPRDITVIARGHSHRRCISVRTQNLTSIPPPSRRGHAGWRSLRMIILLSYCEIRSRRPIAAGRVGFSLAYLAAYLWPEATLSTAHGRLCTVPTIFCCSFLQPIRWNGLVEASLAYRTFQIDPATLAITLAFSAILLCR